MIDLYRRYGGVGLAIRSLVKPVEWWTQLKVIATYTGTASACKKLQGLCTVDADFLLLETPEQLQELEKSILEINPNFSGIERLRVNMAAIAHDVRDPEKLYGYWCFVRKDNYLRDTGVFITPECRGQNLAIELMSRATSAVPNVTMVEAKTSIFNRAASRMLSRCGLKKTRLSWSAKLPLLGDVKGKRPLS